MSAFALVAILAATPITLQQVRELSRRNTQALLSDLDRARAHEQTRIASSAIYPQLDVGTQVSEVYIGPQRSTQGVPVTDPTTGVPTGQIIYRETQSSSTTQGRHNITATLTQLFFDGGKWWNQIRQAGATEEALKGQALEQQMASELEGARRFYALFGAQRALDVYLATVQRSQELLDRANALYEAGRLSKSDAIQAQVNLGNDRITATRQRSTIAAAQSDLAVWIAHPGAEDLVAQDPGTMQGTPPPPPAFDEAAKAARERRPLLKQLASQIRAAESATAVAGAGFFPTISGQATYLRAGSSIDPVFTNIRLQNQFTLGVILRWNLFSGFSTMATQSQAGYSEVTAKLNYEQAQREIQGDLRRYLRAVEIQAETSQIALENRDASAAGLALAEERYRAGVASTLETRDAQLKLTIAELTLLQARIELQNAREALARTMGGYLEEGRP
ncbi:MAG TPA: TolC family protein [Myxococcaceae bacterium]|nr:TolC family protein [Myxococcaceae bacterium]